MSELQKQADEVILRLNRRRKAHACYPCAKRKVRCNGELTLSCVHVNDLKISYR